MEVKKLINHYLRKTGFEISRYPASDLRRRAKIISDLQVDLLLDVGANGGQYGTLARSLGYTGQIISFEPIKRVFDSLQQLTNVDPKWNAFNLALGDDDYTTEINISKNTYSSSILNIEEKHVAAAPESVVTEKEAIIVKRLDRLYPEIAAGFARPFLKLDVQGFEKHVLEGASGVLGRMRGIQLELSLSTLYKNETTITEMLVYMQQKGFELVSLENGLADPDSSYLLQVDGIFINSHKQ